MNKMKKLMTIAAFVAMVGLSPSFAVAHGGMAMKGDDDALDPPKSTITTGQKIGGPFTLRDQNGKTVTDKGFAKNEVIYFGYTSCPDTCPLDLRKMAEAYKLLGDKTNKVQMVFITVDPARDTPSALKTYLSAFPAPITGLTGTTKQIETVEKEYGVYAQKQQSDTMNGYTVDHSSYFYLVSPNGTLLDIISGQETAKKLADSIKTAVGG